MALNDLCSFRNCSVFALSAMCLFTAFTFYLRFMHSDFRYHHLKLPPWKPQKQVHLREVRIPYETQSYQLIQLIDEEKGKKDGFPDNGIVVLSGSSQLNSGQYLQLLQYIDAKNQNETIPFYLVKRKPKVKFRTEIHVKTQIYDIVQILSFFTISLPVKRITLIAYEEGSLLALRSLAYFPYIVFQIVQNLIVINPFNPTLSIHLSSPHAFMEETKRLITRDRLRLMLINNTKIIIINTIDDNMDTNKRTNWMLRGEEGENIRLANSLVVSSKFMWNIYSFLKVHQYFQFQPFLYLVNECFNHLKSRESNIQHIEYLMLYNEPFFPLQMPITQRSHIFNQCIDYHLQNIGYDGHIFNSQCLKVTRKQSIYYNNRTVLMLISNSEFEVYGEEYEKLSPYDTKSAYIYLLQNINGFKRLFIINNQTAKIKLVIHSTYLPKVSVSVGLQYSKYIGKHYSHEEVIQFCPGLPLLFPHHFGPRNVWDQIFYLKFARPQCYQSADYWMIWFEQFIYNWPLGYNMIIFTLVCTHVLQKSTFSRFYTQLMINLVLTSFMLGEILFVENLLAVSIVTLIELLFKIWLWTASLITAPRKIMRSFLWVPVLFELLQCFIPDTFPSSWKILSIQFYALVHSQNIVIAFIQTTYVISNLQREESNLLTLLLVCGWLFLTNQSLAQKKREELLNKKYDMELIKGGEFEMTKKAMLRFSNEIINMLILCILGLIMDEDGIMMHYALDLYIIMHTVFAIYKLYDNCI